MNWLQAAVLGIIQGLTEFLPVSSSGHLVLGSRCLGLPSPGLSFSIWVHIGTAVATVVMLHKEIAWLVKSLLAPETYDDRRRALAIAGYIVAASVPAALVGLLLEDLVDSSFSSTMIASAGLIITGCFLQLSRRKTGPALMERQDRTESPQALTTVTFPRSLVVGVFQAVAIVPGISRSGLTMTSGIMSGMSREDAARFSFLLSLPAVFGSAVLDVRSALAAQVPVVTAHGLIGSAISFLTGLFALGIVFKTVREGELWKFSYYCWAVGICFLALSFARP
ncbi:MAG TPA: undecaprenyl-diphosphate phosphatase [Firmicutes bacterium]|nr:undecaprenyl-diphosphate phosphatase [Candidatus Fermentithermobacillaceae bacterium]